MAFWFVVPVTGGVLAVLGHGTARVIGVTLLVVALPATAVPVSPFLMARIKKRQRQQGR